ncbi:MAG: hypothetical protein CM15mL3_1200 [Kanaloavirus sp.]|nr:MAG: hypothetical protein CM15mL3_1200 [Kanaloavirus sp.]
MKNGTNTLFIKGNGITFQNRTGNENIAYLMMPNGSVDLYSIMMPINYKLKADGVNITGELECDTLDVDGNVDFDGGQVTFNASSNVLDFADNAKASFGNDPDLEIYHNGTDSYIEDKGSGSLIIKGTNS